MSKRSNKSINKLLDNLETMLILSSAAKLRNEIKELYKLLPLRIVK